MTQKYDDLPVTRARDESRDKAQTRYYVVSGKTLEDFELTASDTSHLIGDAPPVTDSDLERVKESIEKRRVQ